MKQLLRYGAVGVVNTGVGYGIIFGCMYLAGLGPVPSNIAGYAVGLIVSYTLNRTFTFRSTGSQRKELPRFVVLFMVAYLANLGVLILLVRVLRVHEGVSQVLAGVVYFALSFVLNKYFVFRRT